jgi:hypothetical protein
MEKVSKYNRSEVVSFFELTDDQQTDVLTYTDVEDAEGAQYVIFKCKGGITQALSLSNFMRAGGRWHGIYGTSYFSAYGVILSKCGSAATVALLTW